MIRASNAGVDDKFGWSLDISGDTLAVGTPYEDSNQRSITNGSSSSTNNSYANSGAVYVYKRSGNTWAQEAYIKSTSSVSTYSFGNKVSLRGDILAVGAWNYDIANNYIEHGESYSVSRMASDAGAVFVFKRTGNEWKQIAFLNPSNAKVGGDQYGISVAFDNQTLVVGSHQEDGEQCYVTNGTSSPTTKLSTDTGAVYVYYFD